MALLPPPDISQAYVDLKTGDPTKELFNWLKQLYDYTRGITGGGGGGGTPGGSVGQVQYNAGGGVFGGYTNTQVTALLDLANVTTKGAVPPPGSSSGRFLDDTLNWSTPPGGGGGGTPGGANGNIQYNNAGVFGGLTDVQLTARVQAFTSLLSGAVPPGGALAGSFLRFDGVWAIPPSGGGGGGLLWPPSIQLGLAGNAAGTAETTLFSYTLPANTVSLLGRGVHITADGYFAGVGTGFMQEQVIRLYFGSEVFVLDNLVPDTSRSRWHAEMEAMIAFSPGAGAQWLVSGWGSSAFPVKPYGNDPFIASNAPILIKVTGQSPAAGIANHANCYRLLVSPTLTDIASVV